MKVTSNSKPGTSVTYPLFVTTQETGIGLFSTTCVDCGALKPFNTGDAVGYAAGATQAVNEWVNLYDKTESELEALKFSGTYSTTAF